MSDSQDIKEMEGKLPLARLASAPFQVVSPYEPSGDQPQAIEKLAANVKAGLRYQTLLGVTGSGKTFTMAKTIEAVQKPTLILAPNKTLAAQLAAELKEFFPHNAVVYFVSYYDYYQPEAYVPASDTFLHREGFVHQRGSGEAAPRRNKRAAFPPRHYCSGKCFVHLRHWQPSGLCGNGRVP